MDYKKFYEGTVAHSLTPTFENVTREFTIYTMQEILLNENCIKFNFDFKEEEAIEFLSKILENDFRGFSESIDESELSEFYNKYALKIKKRNENILNSLKNSRGDNDLPTLVIKDYKLFFELLRQIYEKFIELHFRRVNRSGFTVFEKNNLFLNIWLRATPEDFNNSEKFLEKQVKMINDNTFNKFNSETEIGKLSYLGDSVICIKNDIGRTWDENFSEFKTLIYEEEHYDNQQLFNRPHLELPVIRYGIYEKDEQKICYIGSIQNKVESSSPIISKAFNKIRFKINKGVPLENNSIYNVEPSHVIALSIFINFLHNEGIYEIEVPEMYALDYQYHLLCNENFKKEFELNWSREKILEEPNKYREEQEYLNSKLNKEDLISKSKTEKFTNTFMRLMYHYKKSNIISYPGDVDSFMHFNIPPVESDEDLDIDMLRELNDLVNEVYNNSKLR